MSFEGVSMSVAGLVVLSFAVMRSDLGPVLFDRRLWRSITFVAAMTFVLAAQYRPDDFKAGMETTSEVIAREVKAILAPVFAHVEHDTGRASPATRPTAQASGRPWAWRALLKSPEPAGLSSAGEPYRVAAAKAALAC